MIFNSRKVLSVAIIVMAAIAMGIGGYLAPSGDFREFYGAARALLEGRNPYDPFEMLELQRDFLGKGELNQALMMWTHPGVLLFMAPWRMQLSYEGARIIWNLVSAGYFAAAVFLLARTFPIIFEDWAALGAVLLCAPLLDAVRLGQSTSVLLLAISASIFAAVRNSFGAAGGTCALILLKPHLFILSSWGFVLDVWKRGAIVRWCLGALLAVVVFAVFTEQVFPGSTSMWFHTIGFEEGSEYTVPRSAWICTSLPCAARAYCDISSPVLSIVLPVVFLVVFAWIIVTKRYHPRFPEDLSLLIPLSLLCAPYGWIYDQSLCLIGVAALLGAESDRSIRVQSALLLIVWNVVAAVWYLTVISYQHQLWWYPTGPLLIALRHRALAAHKLTNPERGSFQAG